MISSGNCSRPLKPGTLKFLALSVVQSRTLVVALHRLTQFFRLVLDDLHFELASSNDRVSVVLQPQTEAVRRQRFTQEVMLKLVHGIASWLADWMFVSFAERIVSHRVREHLDKRLASTTRIEDVAKTLLTSSRTLARRLDEEGTSFQVIKDELRRDVAIQLLTQTSLAPAEVGARTGFEDPTTFYRAFKRWTGCSPGVYRRMKEPRQKKRLGLV